MICLSAVAFLHVLKVQIIIAVLCACLWTAADTLFFFQASTYCTLIRQGCRRVGANPCWLQARCCAICNFIFIYRKVKVLKWKTSLTLYNCVVILDKIPEGSLTLLVSMTFKLNRWIAIPSVPVEKTSDTSVLMLLLDCGGALFLFRSTWAKKNLHRVFLKSF